MEFETPMHVHEPDLSDHSYRHDKFVNQKPGCHIRARLASPGMLNLPFNWQEGHLSQTHIQPILAMVLVFWAQMIKQQGQNFTHHNYPQLEVGVTRTSFRVTMSRSSCVRNILYAQPPSIYCKKCIAYGILAFATFVRVLFRYLL